MKKDKEETVVTESEPVKIKEDYSKLLKEFIEKRGQGIQKVFIKKLWSVHEDLVENASPSELRMMFFTSTLPCSPEGVKLLASFISKIGTSQSFRIFQKLVVQFGATSTDCHRYGDVFKTAWKMAENEGNYDLKEEIETEIISQLCYLSIFGHRPYCGKFREVMVSFAQEKKKDRNFDVMMTSKLNSCLYQGLTAVNDIVRSSAADVFFLFYPLVDSDSDEMKKSLDEQYRIMMDLLTDKSISIRVDAIKKVLKILAEYWLLISKDVVRQLMGLIIDKLSRDSVVNVRVSVFEGMTYLAIVPSCMNAFEHALKCICLRGINDKSDRVRLVAFNLLSQLKNHRFINVFDIVSKDEVIARLDIEPVEAVRKQIVPLIHIILPMSENLDESYYRPRVNQILGKSRIAILTYFRMLYPMKIITVEMGIKLIEMLLLWAYRYLRKKDGPPLAEEAEGYRKARAYLECALVLYTSCKPAFAVDNRAALKTNLETKFSKLVREIFENYRETPIIGTATAISSSISKDVLKGLANDFFAMLNNDEIPDEAIEPFLESASHCNIDNLFDSVDEGLDVLSDLLNCKKNQKKMKKGGKSVDQLIKSLRFLKYITKSHSTANLIATREIYRQRLKDFAKKIDSICEIIDIKLEMDTSNSEKFEIDEESLLTALELRFILPIICVSNTNDEEDLIIERKELKKTMKEILSWFNSNIASKLATFEEESQDFLERLTKSFFDCVNVALSSWDFEYDVDEEEMEVENDENSENPQISRVSNESHQKERQESVAEVVSKIVVSFCNSGTPMILFAPVLKVATILCDDKYVECHVVMTNVLNFTPKWVKKYCESDEQEDIDEKEITDALRAFYRKVAETEVWNDQASNKLIHLIAILTIVFLTDAADEVEFEDPRSATYQPPQWVTIMIHRFVCKEKELLKEFLIQLGRLLDSKEFIGDDVGINMCLVRIGALSQLVLIILAGKYGFEANANFILETCKTKTKQYLQDENVENVDDYVVNSLKSLFELESEEYFL